MGENVITEGQGESSERYDHTGKQGSIKQEVGTNMDFILSAVLDGFKQEGL